MPNHHWVALQVVGAVAQRIHNAFQPGFLRKLREAVEFPGFHIEIVIVSQCRLHERFQFPNHSRNAVFNPLIFNDIEFGSRLAVRSRMANIAHRCIGDIFFRFFGEKQNRCIFE